MLNDLYFKTTCMIRPLFLGPIGGLKIEGPLYNVALVTSNTGNKSAGLVKAEYNYTNGCVKNYYAGACVGLELKESQLRGCRCKGFIPG